MDANITVMIAIKKRKGSPSSFLFNDTILGWAGNENKKKDLNLSMICGHFKALLNGQTKKLMIIRKM